MSRPCHASPTIAMIGNQVGYPAAMPDLSIDLLVPAMPPVRDAIGEYTECLALSLMDLDCRVSCFTSHQDYIHVNDRLSADPCFSLDDGFIELNSRLQSTRADAVVLQYNPFGWGLRGYARGLVSTLRNFRKNRPEVFFSVMFHETYVMNPGWKPWVMRRYQLPQFYRLAELTDVSFFSTGVWAETEMRRRQNARAVHLPVGSNLPLSIVDPRETRHRLGVDMEEFVLGVFGGNHPSRLLEHVATAIKAIEQSGCRARLVCVGTIGAGLLELLDRNGSDMKSIDLGHQPPKQTADAIASMDLLLSPFIDGLSTRRGSAMAAFQHGVPVLSTAGISTDDVFLDVNMKCLVMTEVADLADYASEAVMLANDLGRCDRIGTNGRQLYEQRFDWPVIAKRLIDSITKPS